MFKDRSLAAIMFTDILGYTALMGSEEDKAFQLLNDNRNLQRPIVKKYRGQPARVGNQRFIINYLLCKYFYYIITPSLSSHLRAETLWRASAKLQRSKVGARGKPTHTSTNPPDCLLMLLSYGN
jgi:hypothetical protein